MSEIWGQADSCPSANRRDGAHNRPRPPKGVYRVSTPNWGRGRPGNSTRLLKIRFAHKTRRSLLWQAEGAVDRLWEGAAYGLGAALDGRRRRQPSLASSKVNR